MIGDVSRAERIYIVCGYTDMRKAIDGLAAIVQQNFKLDVFSGSLFLFCGKRCDRIKALLWEEDGFVLLYKRLENGKTKKGVGGWLRVLSIDEFPQFFNVLKGEMSIVGTRPPTLDEWEKYELHHRARLAIKPGITGMWQANGRSEITDFEKVVELDTSYIRDWSLALDFKIILKTILTVFKREGSM